MNGTWQTTGSGGGGSAVVVLAVAVAVVIGGAVVRAVAAVPVWFWACVAAGAVAVITGGVVAVCRVLRAAGAGWVAAGPPRPQQLAGPCRGAVGGQHLHLHVADPAQAAELAEAFRRGVPR